MLQHWYVWFFGYLIVNDATTTAYNAYRLRLIARAALKVAP